MHFGFLVKKEGGQLSFVGVCISGLRRKCISVRAFVFFSVFFFGLGVCIMVSYLSMKEGVCLWWASPSTGRPSCFLMGRCISRWAFYFGVGICMYFFFLLE